MDGIGGFLIIWIIVLPFYLLYRFIINKINNGIDNAVDSIAAHARNKKFKNQGTQNLADRYNNNNNNNFNNHTRMQ